MTSDLNLTQKFKDFQELENSGFCSCTDARDNLKATIPPVFNTSISKLLYYRING